MGCFLGCFGGSKDSKRRKQRNNVFSQDPIYGNQKPLETNVYSELRDKPQEQFSLRTRKRVTFDSCVSTHENVLVNDSVTTLLERDRGGVKEKDENFAKAGQYGSVPEVYSVTSSAGLFPPNHRYQNCRDSDDEAEEYGHIDLDADDDEEQEISGACDEVDDDTVEVQVFSESVPMTSMRSRTENSSTRAIMKEVGSPIMRCGLNEEEVKSIRLNGNGRDRSVYVHPVLKPVDNLTHWKSVKSKGEPLLKPQKENFTVDHEAHRVSSGSESSLKHSSTSYKSKHQCNNQQHNNLNQAVAVDASLSNWLVSSEISPTKKTSFTRFETIPSEKSASQGSNSAMSLEDRPILGAWTVKELKQYSASSSPRKSPSRSPDEMPIIGTVGTYWNQTGEAKVSGSTSSIKGIPNTTSKYREDKRVNWHATPFETRLERALNRGATEA